MTWRPAFWLYAAGVVVVDQLTKQWALETLEPYVEHPVLGDLLSIQLVFNSGAAFSLGDETTWILTIVAALVTVGIVVYGRRAQRPWAAAVFGIALGGALGNLIDRIFRQPSFGEGHVVDMINYADQFVGNVADIAIVGAAIAIVGAGLFSKPILEPAEGDAGDDAGDTSASTSADADATGTGSDAAASSLDDAGIDTDADTGGASRRG
ncbi:signal peptidase II [Demequina sp. SYSU T00192]|uniref:Lipoprotein signal peptidase n=1 Tax=Demequina litoralis TaxID=3051660 RepID=A0ABT8GAM9_9MICO|nr:signal peptidase II [Demequina sp. SYSU T00192]MDN4476198.1 signal peptidase II [Demequina sp. SYSU T00192]